MSDRLAEIEARLNAARPRSGSSDAYRLDRDVRGLLRLARVVSGLVIVNHSGQTYCEQCYTAVGECQCPIGVLRTTLAELEDDDDE